MDLNAKAINAETGENAAAILQAITQTNKFGKIHDFSLPTTAESTPAPQPAEPAPVAEAPAHRE